MSLTHPIPDLTSLDVFASVVELGSLGRAAAAHRISQPSASERVRRLEQQLGVTLLRRTPTGSVPTEAGTVVVEWATDVLAAADRFTASVKTLRAGEHARLRIAASNTVAEQLLPEALGRFLATHGSGAPRLEVTNSDGVVLALRAGAVDVGFVEGPRCPDGFHSRTVGTDEVVVVVAAGHPWARRRRPLAPAALAAAGLVQREEGSGTRQAFDAALRHAGAEPAPPRLELGSTAAVKRAVLEGIGPGVVSRLSVAAEAQAGTMHVVPVAGVSVRRRLRAVWPTDGTLRPAVAALVDEVASVGAQLG